MTSLALIAAFLAAALLLSIERLTYIFAWHRPTAFARLCARMRLGPDPVGSLESLFYGFKVIQITVFASWIIAFSDGAPWPSSEPAALILGAVLMLIGQVLNLSTFWRLGRIGVFYGTRFGHQVAWCQRFPFNWLRHPQYVGTVLSIWGLFMFFRLPHADWFLLPTLLTVYYVLGSQFESDGPPAAHKARTPQIRRSDDEAATPGVQSPIG